MTAATTAAMNGAGPVLEPGDVADAVIAAIRARHPDAVVDPRGAYVRVWVPERCRIERADVELRLGRPFVLPGDLEAAMPSFLGRFRVSTDAAEWWTP